MPPIYSKEWNRITIQVRGDHRQGRTSPCEHACPLGNGIQQMHTLIAAGETGKALARLHARNPFPGITGRVCPHPCETKCNRAEYDEPVAIHALERFAADTGHETRFIPLPASGKRLAVVGSGPAGLTAARFAALLGHAVTVDESAPVMGGVPRHAVPDFRLPKDVVDRETGAIVASGVQVRTNVTVGRDITLQSLLDTYDATILAVGLWKERRLDIPGKEHLVPAVGWLKRSTLERQSLAGKTVVILGGGGVAFDCAFTARRLNADAVHIVCLEPTDAMRAPAEEVQQALDEGIVIHNSHLSHAVAPEGGRLRFEARPVTSFSFDETGALHTEFAPGDPLCMNADLVICASGLQTDETPLEGVDMARTPRGFVAVDPVSFRTSVPGLYAAGDIANGPSLIARAIGHGRQAAIAVHKALSGMDPAENLDIWIDETGRVREDHVPALPAPHVVAFKEIMHADYHGHAARQILPPAASDGPELAFAELSGGLAAEAAVAEAGRCMHCGHCMECGSCVESCPGHILEMTDDGPAVAYPSQCWHCGCCRIACPTGSIAYRFPMTMML